MVPEKLLLESVVLLLILQAVDHCRRQARRKREGAGGRRRNRWLHDGLLTRNGVRGDFSVRSHETSSFGRERPEVLCLKKVTVFTVGLLDET